MSETELKEPPVERAVAPPKRAPLKPSDITPGRSIRLRALPILLTLIAVALAGVLSWGMWQAYMASPWTRDGTVRAYVVTIAPEVAGRIVELPIVDNQFVHKGDLLMGIDPTDYAIAVQLTEAAVEQAKVNADNAQREAARQEALNDLAVSVEQQQTYVASAQAAQASYQQAVGEPRPGPREPRAHQHPLSGQWLRDQPAGAAWRLRQGW
jgi:multidrug resistance efflux pump